MKPRYITPRLVIANLSNHGNVDKLVDLVESRHKQYHHYFNLTMFRVREDKESPFKWRGIPFSITETIRIVTQIDAFLRINIANAAIICVNNQAMEQYGLFIIKTYIKYCSFQVKKEGQVGSISKILKLGEQLLTSHPYLFQQICQIYRNIRIELPPLKLLYSLVIEPQDLFVPIPQIFTETRYNQYQTVYQHPIQEDLAVYYVDLHRPLQTGIGIRYYDQKPQTKYFKAPILVYGDVKIVVYSYKHLIKVHQFTIGFNTLHMDELTKTQGLLILQDSDLYDKKKEQQKPIKIKIQFGDYCFNQSCKTIAKCQECKDVIKKMAGRYNDCQMDLDKVHRMRSKEEIRFLFGI